MNFFDYDADKIDYNIIRPIDYPLIVTVLIHIIRATS